MSVILFFRHPNTYTLTGTVTQDEQHVFAIGRYFPSFQIQDAIVPAYAYQQYSDDPNITAWFDALNALTQSYVEWFNTSAFAAYSLPGQNGPLLDWCATGIWGIKRPVFSSGTSRFAAGLNAGPLNTAAINFGQVFHAGTAILASDDYYRRTLTWILYLGDGRYCNASVLRRKVARFIFGVDGTDVTAAQAEAISIVAGFLHAPLAPTLSSASAGSLTARSYGVRYTYITPLGETLPGPATAEAVASNHVLVADSPAAEPGATHYNAYVAQLTAFPSKFLGALNTLPVNGQPIGGTNLRAQALLTLQNELPIEIGTNWTEPTSGLITGAQLPVTDTSNEPTNFIITVPAGTAATFFDQALALGVLPIPFQLTASVIIA